MLRIAANIPKPHRSVGSDVRREIVQRMDSFVDQSNKDSLSSDVCWGRKRPTVMVEGVNLGVGGQQGLATQRVAVPRGVVEGQHAVGIALTVRDRAR